MICSSKCVVLFATGTFAFCTCTQVQWRLSIFLSMILHATLADDAGASSTTSCSLPRSQPNENFLYTCGVHGRRRGGTRSEGAGSTKRRWSSRSVKVRSDGVVTGHRTLAGSEFRDMSILKIRWLEESFVWGGGASSESTQPGHRFCCRDLVDLELSLSPNTNEIYKVQACCTAVLTQRCARSNRPRSGSVRARAGRYTGQLNPAAFNRLLLSTLHAQSCGRA